MKIAKSRVARASPSGSHRWVHCHGYLQAIVDIPEQEANEYALEGTTAHAVLELSSILDVEPAKFVGKRIEKREVSLEMVEAVAVAMDFVAQWAEIRPGCVVLYEHEVSITLGAYMIHGTADIVLWNEKTRELVVIDYKHGAGFAIDAENNYQLALYLLGCIAQYPAAKTLTGIIIQPRSAREGQTPIKEWRVKPSVLRQIESQCIEALHLAHEKGIPRSAGTHCRWCPVAGKCRTLAEYSMRTAMKEFEAIEKRPVIDPEEPQNLNADGIAYALSQVFVIEGWLRAVESEAVKRLMAQQPVPGYKLTVGRRMSAWANEDRVVKVLQGAGIPQDTYAPRSLRSPAQILEVVKRMEKIKYKVSALITKKPGAPHVAPENDPRPAIAGSAGLVFQPVPKKDKPIKNV